MSLKLSLKKSLFPGESSVVHLVVNHTQLSDQRNIADNKALV